MHWILQESAVLFLRNFEGIHDALQSFLRIGRSLSQAAINENFNYLRIATGLTITIWNDTINASMKIGR
ncbi:MAG: hypothetical protein ACI4OD_10095, partial [Selenomonas sp.]